MSHRIVIGGPRNCGKSTLAASIYTRLQDLSVGVGIYEIDVFSDTIPCILGIKPWEKRQKRESGNWRDPLIDLRLDAFSRNASRIVLGDLPGVIDDLLEKMVRPATAAIAIGKSEEGLAEWLKFFHYQSIPVILKIASYLEGLNGWADQATFPGLLRVGDMNRRVLYNNEIRAVVNRLLAVCK